MNVKSDRVNDIFGKEDVLPFVEKEPKENNPDLLYEMNTQLKVSFNAMIGDIDSITKEARALDYQENIAKYLKSLNMTFWRC